MTQLAPSKRLEQPPWLRWATAGALWVISAVLYLALDHISQIPESLLLPVLVVHAGASAITAYLLLHVFLTTGRLRTLAMSVAFSYAAFTIAMYRIALPVSDARILGIRHEMAPAFWALWHIGFAALLTTALAIPKVSHRFIWSSRSRMQLGIVSVVLSFSLAALGSLTVILDKGIDAEVSALRLVPHYLHDWLYAVNTSVASSIDFATWSVYLFISSLSFFALVASFRLSRSLDRIEGWVTIAAATSLLGVFLTRGGETVNSGGWYVSSMAESLGSVVVVLAILHELLTLYRFSERDREYLELQTAQLFQTTQKANKQAKSNLKIITNAADPYVEIDAAGLITSWNGKAEQMFGIKLQEVLRKPLSEVIMSAEGAGPLEELITELWQDKANVSGAHAELLVQKADKDLLTVEATMWINEDPESPRMSFFLRDITRRKREEERLASALRDERLVVFKLQEVDRERSNFVSSVSHELRSPLTSLTGYLEVVLDGGVGEITEAQRDKLLIVQRNADRLTALIEDLLTFNRIEKNALEIEHQAVNLNEVIERAVQRHKTYAEQRRIALSYESGFELGGCPGDSDMIERAISNVISNAVKFTTPGGMVDVVAESHRGQVAIVISDNGLGIAKEEQSQLFKAFHRSQHVIDSQHQGTGLGLTITKAIIEQHHGEIHINSRLGKGTSVTIMLPAVPLQSPDKEHPSDQDEDPTESDDVSASDLSGPATEQPDSTAHSTTDTSTGDDSMPDQPLANDSPDGDSLPSTVET